MSVMSCTAVKRFTTGETIEFMRKAAIKVWVLTGDKTGTARSVALSCKLVDPDMTELLIDGKHEDEVNNSLKKALRQVETDKDALFYTMVTGDAILTLQQHEYLEHKVSFLHSSPLNSL